MLLGLTPVHGKASASIRSTASLLLQLQAALSAGQSAEIAKASAVITSRENKNIPSICDLWCFLFGSFRVLFVAVL